MNNKQGQKKKYGDWMELFLCENSENKCRWDAEGQVYNLKKAH